MEDFHKTLDDISCNRCLQGIFSNKPLEPKQVLGIADALRKNVSVTYLCLDYCVVDLLCADALAEALVSNKTLMRLDPLLSKRFAQKKKIVIFSNARHPILLLTLVVYWPKAPLHG